MRRLQFSVTVDAGNYKYPWFWWPRADVVSDWRCISFEITVRWGWGELSIMTWLARPSPNRVNKDPVEAGEEN